MPRTNNIQIRKGTSSDWNSANPVLASGEPGFETDSNRLKVGVNLNWDDTNYISADSLVTTVYNNGGTTISKFNVVYINGGQGNKPTIALSIANSEATSSKTYGVTVNDIPSQSSGLVIVNGALKNLNTNTFGSNKEGSSLWLSPTVSGGLTLTKPYAPDHSVFVGTIIRSHNTQGVVEVKIQNGYELEELHNVAITGTTNGQFLQYNSTSGLWVPSSSGNFTNLTINNNPVVTGGGTSGYLSKFNSSQGVANSLVFDDGTRVGIGTTSPTADLHVNGSGLFSNNIIINGNSPIVENRFSRMTPVGNIALENGNSNFITFRSAGTGLCPINSTFNSGLKILLRPTSINQPPIAIGLSNNSLWHVVSTTGWNYEWNAGANNLATLSGNGILSVSSGISSPVGNFTSGLNTNGLNNFKDITILGKNSIPTWNQFSLYNKTDVVKFENQYYTALSNFTTECPAGIGPEGWFCCDETYIAPTATDCPGFGQLPEFTSFSPTGYKIGWAILGSGDYAAQNGYSYNLYNHNNITSSAITVNDLLVKQGVIRVNNSFLNTFNMTINSSGINIVDTAADITVSNVSSLSLSSATILSNTSWQPGRLFSIWEVQANVSIGDLVLFTNFDSSSYNGVYKAETPIPSTDAGNVRFVRASGFINGTVLTNGISINVINNSKTFILNQGIPGTSTVGSSSLSFTVDDGQSVMRIQANKNVTFAAGVSSSAIFAEEKYFKIKHPDPNSKYSSLQYGSLESPYHGVRLTGKDKLKNGICEILLPDYLKYLIHEEDVSIQLTNYGHHKMLYVDKIDLKNNKFIVKGYRSKSGGPFNFYWSFTGIRKDVSILIPEQ